MGGLVWRLLKAACLPCLLAGCVSVHAPSTSIPPSMPLTPTATGPAPVDTVQPAVAPDGPTLRLALSDLAVLLDTLVRLEQIDPEFRVRMLAELTDADPDTAAAVVRGWRDRLVDLEHVAPRHPLAVAEHIAGSPAASSDAPAGEANRNETAAGKPPADSPPGAIQLVSELRPAQDTPSVTPLPEPPQWDELVELLLEQSRVRAEGSGAQANRARVQLALLELLRETERGSGRTNRSDAHVWQQLGLAIEFYLDARPPDARSSAESLAVLSAATERLRGPARFEARNLAFCRRIAGYGNIEPAESSVFAAGQPVLLYSEVENLSSEHVPGGVRTKLSSELAVVDAERQVVWRQQFAAVEDRSSVPRRDYFLSHTFRLPSSLQPGRYSVAVTLHDELANRSTSSAIPLVVR